MNLTHKFHIDVFSVLVARYLAYRKPLEAAICVKGNIEAFLTQAAAGALSAPA